MDTERILLPRQLETDQRAGQLIDFITNGTSPLREGKEKLVPAAELGKELEKALIAARMAGHVVRGLEITQKALENEERGLFLSGNSSENVRLSRLLLLTNDGSERFYRKAQEMLDIHEPRLLVVRLDATAWELGEILFGKGKLCRAILVNHKDDVSRVLLALIDSSTD